MIVGSESAKSFIVVKLDEKKDLAFKIKHGFGSEDINKILLTKYKNKDMFCQPLVLPDYKGHEVVFYTRPDDKLREYLTNPDVRFKVGYHINTYLCSGVFTMEDVSLYYYEMHYDTFLDAYTFRNDSFEARYGRDKS